MDIPVPPYWLVTPHGCRPPNWHVTSFWLVTPSPRCTAMMAAKYVDLWGQISSLQVEMFEYGQSRSAKRTLLKQSTRSVHRKEFRWWKCQNSLVVVQSNPCTREVWFVCSSWRGTFQFILEKKNRFAKKSPCRQQVSHFQLWSLKTASGRIKVCILETRLKVLPQMWLFLCLFPKGLCAALN